MKRFWGDIALSKVFCDPFGSTFFNNPSFFNDRGYTGKVYYNNENKEIVDFWSMIHTQKKRLLKEISVMKANLSNYEAIEDREKYIENKLNDSRELHRASAFYLSKYGALSAKQDENIITQLVECSEQVQFTSLALQDCIKQVDSPDTFIYMTPSIQIDIKSKEFIQMIRDIKGIWVLDTFYEPKLAECYGEFYVNHLYNRDDTRGYRLTTTVSNIL